MNRRHLVRFWQSLYGRRWRLLAIAVVVAVAWVLAYFLTPYRPTPTTQFAVTENPHANYLRAEVLELHGDSGKARIVDGEQRGRVVPIRFYGAEKVQNGMVLISEDTTIDTPNAAQPWRIPGLLLLMAVMLAAVLAIGGRQGAMSVLGLGVSIAVIVYYILPTASSGGNALLASVIGAYAIATIAIIVAHRMRWRTFVSLLCIYITLAVVIGLTLMSGWLVSLSGVYDETSSILYQAGQSGLDMYGILLGGIIIATLGVLDDVVTTQVAAIDELRGAKPHASWRELYGRGMSVGREHLSALINTLALAYVGVALPTVLILSHQISGGVQLLSVVNYEYISLEITRTIISSLGIILAIPLSTVLAVWLIGRKQQIFAILETLQSKLRR